MNTIKFYFYDFKVKGVKYYYVSKSPLSNKNLHKHDREELLDVRSKLIAKYLIDEEDPLRETYKDFALPPGTVLDTFLEVVFKPKVFSIDARLETQECKRYKVIDGTLVNIYTIEGRRMLGTKNSWDISNIQDFVRGTTYADYFNEVLKTLKLELESGTYLFCHPRIHLMTSKQAVYSYSEDKVSPPPLAGEDDTEFIEYYPQLGGLYEHISSERNRANNVMYSMRTKFMSDNYETAIGKCMVNFHCRAMAGDYKNYVKDNKLLNSFAMEASSQLFTLTRTFMNTKGKITSYHGAKIPRKLLSRRGNCLNEEFIDFWTEAYINRSSSDVVANALRSFVVA